MKRFIAHSLSLWLLFGAAASAAAPDPTARLQVIHNSSDPGAAVVDVYVNDTIFLDDFAYRTATPFVDVPAGVELAIGVAPGNSTSAADIIATFPAEFRRGRTYVAVADGVLDPAAFAPNPDGGATAFTLNLTRQATERAHGKRRVDLVVHHGATDAPAVDVRFAGDRRPFVSHLSYGEFAKRRTVHADRYLLDVTPAGDPGTIVGTFEADLSGLGGGAAVVFASGFLDPTQNQGGAAFGLFAALPGGTVLELPAESKTARVQIIHNSADPAAQAVDIYASGTLLLDDFAFRTATPFLDVPADVPLTIGVAPATSTSSADALAEFDVTFAFRQTYVVVATGVLDPAAFAPNPDGLDTAFTLVVRDGIREESRWDRFVQIIGVHGATDAPEVDVLARWRRWQPNDRWRAWRIVNDLAFGESSSYRNLLARRTLLAVTPSNDNSTIVAAFEADLTGLRGASAIVFASGFLDPTLNQGGAAFGLFAALADGTVLALPAAPHARDAGAWEIVGEEATLADEADEIAAAAEESPGPGSITLAQNSPNPFNPTTKISFSVPAASRVELTIFNVQGQEVRRLIDGPLAAGIHTVSFAADDLSSGVYYYRLQADGLTTQVRRMMLVK